MTKADLEKRVAALEAELARLREMIENAQARSRGLEEGRGSFANDPMFDEAMRLGTGISRVYSSQATTTRKKV